VPAVTAIIYYAKYVVATTLSSYFTVVQQ